MHETSGFWPWDVERYPQTEDLTAGEIRGCSFVSNTWGAQHVHEINSIGFVEYEAGHRCGRRVCVLANHYLGT